ncbi:MAG: helix-hairpin-helix domain-containing protein [Verrucomicrobiaceae bacterium]|nr:helix-hairpin-helix domain-containing protein [Verrucomicrobiaceae bacterium]
MQRYLQRLDINQATQQQIVALPGIGPVLAKAILKKRPFHRVEDLAEVKGIGSHLLERLEPLIRAEALPTRFRFGKPVFPPSER